MKVTAHDNTQALLALAQALRNVEQRQHTQSIRDHLQRDENAQAELRLARQRQTILQDQLYLERALVNARQLKGTNVDLYI